MYLITESINYHYVTRGRSINLVALQKVVIIMIL